MPTMPQRQNYNPAVCGENTLPKRRHGVCLPTPKNRPVRSPKSFELGIHAPHGSSNNLEVSTVQTRTKHSSIKGDKHESNCFKLRHARDSSTRCRGPWQLDGGRKTPPHGIAAGYSHQHSPVRNVTANRIVVDQVNSGGAGVDKCEVMTRAKLEFMMLVPY